MDIVFFEHNSHQKLLPLTYTKPVSHLRVGILTIKEKWEKHLNTSSTDLTSAYLTPLFQKHINEENIFIWSSCLPNAEFVEEVKSLKTGEALSAGGQILAYKGKQIQDLKDGFGNSRNISDVKIINHPWNIFEFNGQEIENDINLLDLSSSNLSSHTKVYGSPEKIFIHPSAKIFAQSLNTENGSIYIGENTEIMEGSVIRGPFALCEGAVVKMGAKIYKDTTIGPYSKVGGEISNCVIQGYSNKGHDGFIGNSVIGEWCNLGADTNSSNLKNNYSTVKVWDYEQERAKDSGLSFCGLIMGDHNKTGINTMLNTGTVVGVGSNIFGANFPPKFIPSFSWGSGAEFVEHDFEKFCETAQKVMARRNQILSDDQKSVLKKIFESSAKYRN